MSHLDRWGIIAGHWVTWPGVRFRVKSIGSQLGALLEMWKWGLGRRSDAPGLDAGAALCPSCRWLGMGNSAPAALPNGNAAGGLGPEVQNMGDTPAGIGFWRVPLRVAKDLRTARRVPKQPVPPRTPGAGTDARGHPGTGAHPHAEWKRVREASPPGGRGRGGWR